MRDAVDVEKAVLGVIVLENKRLGEIEAILERDDFARDAHRRLYSAMLKLGHKNQPIDYVTLMDDARTSGELEAIGGAAYISSLSDGIPVGCNVRHYAGRVKEESIRRQLGVLGSWIQQAVGGETDTSEVFNRIEKRIAELRDSYAKINFKS